MTILLMHKAATNINVMVNYYTFWSKHGNIYTEKPIVLFLLHPTDFFLPGDVDKVPYRVLKRVLKQH